MRILLGISALVLVAILWTAFSISRHIRLTRRRNRFLREQQLPAHGIELEDEPFTPAAPPPPPPAVAPLPARFAAPTALAPLPAKPVANQVHTTRTVETQAPQPVEPSPGAPSFPGFARREIKREPTPLTAQPTSPQPAAQPLRIMEFVPERSPAPPPPPRRPVRSAAPPPRAAAAAAGRPAWDYFNKDMGDLSDPTPSRIRDRVRPR